MTPPPASKNVQMAAACAEILATSALVRSQPPQLTFEATTIALYLVGSKSASVTLPATLGSTFVNVVGPAAPRMLVRVLTSSPPGISNESTGNAGLVDPARAKISISFNWLPGSPTPPPLPQPSQ